MTMAELDERSYESWLLHPEKVTAQYELLKTAHRQSGAEGRTYLAMWTKRPSSTGAANAGNFIIGSDGLRDLGFNVMADALRGALTQICVPLKPNVSPIGGTWETKQACEGLGQVVDGFFTLNDFPKIARRMMTHAAWVSTGGVGIIEIDNVKKDLACSTLDPLTTFFNADRTEVITLRAINRRKAIGFAKTEEAKRAVRDAPRYKPDRLIEVDETGQWDAEDMVGIVQGWAETIGDDVGKYSYALLGRSDCVVLDSGDWDGPLPVLDAEWSGGYRGEGDGRPLGRSLAPIDHWMNECIRKVDDALAGAVPMVSGPGKEPPVSDVPFQWFDTTDGPVNVSVPKVLSGDIQAWMGELKAQVGHATGINEDTQKGAPPPNIKSGVGLSTWVGIVNANLGEQHEAYARIYTKAFRIAVYLMSKVYTGSKKARTLARDTRILNQIDFSKVNVKEDAYSLSFDVVSDLPKHIPQKFELVSALHELDPEEFDIGDVFQHLDVVDFKAAKDRINGPRDLMMKQISKALNEGEFIPPDETQDHDKLAKLCAQAMSAAKASFYPPPEEHLQKLLWLYLSAKQMGEDVAPLPAPAPVQAATPLGGGLSGLAASTAGAEGALPSTATAQPLPTPNGPVS